MLALTLVPCGDGGGGIIEIANQLFEVEHQHASDHGQHSNDCGDDTCTPFCICSCCSSALDTPAKLPLLVETITPVPRTKPSFIPNFILSNHNPFVWQPPKFS
jgi:hypothetical protein